MSTETTFDRVRHIVSEFLAIPEESAKPEDELAILGADSLDVVEIAMVIESEFDIEFAPDDDTTLNNPNLTVQQLSDLTDTALTR